MNMKKITPFLLSIIFILYSLFLVRDVLSNQLTGTFATHTVPKEYLDLNLFLEKSPSFSRSLWIPQIQRFGNFSYQKPAISGSDFLNSFSLQKQISILKNPIIQKRIEEAGIRYIIIPYDSEKEIFLRDRKYYDLLYKKTIQEIGSIPWLSKKISFGKVVVFEVPSPRDRFWTEGNISLNW